MNQLIQNKFLKAARIQGRSLVMRNATVEDASFILSLRTDAEKAKFLSITEDNLEKQKKWLEDYANLTDQAYFIIENSVGLALGTVRIYDAKEKSFCWGSWILKKNAPQNAAIESALMIYSYALDYLGFEAAHFDVRIGNENVWRFHERFGAIRSSEDNFNYIYNIDNKSIKIARIKYKKYLCENVNVFPLNSDCQNNMSPKNES